MIKEIKFRGITWIDLESPTRSEVDDISRKYKIHPLVVVELTEPSQRSKVDLYKSYIYLILHFPTCQICFGEHKKENLAETQEVDFIIGKDYIITTHYEAIESLEASAARLESEADEAHEDAEGPIHAGFVFYHIMKHIYNSLEEGLHFINSSLKTAEKKIFRGGEKSMVKVLSEINHNLLDFRWALKSHREILASLEDAGLDFFGARFGYHLRAISGEFEKLWNMLGSNRELFLDLRDTNDSLLSIKTNEVMKTLTILAFVTFPLSVFTSLFGMNTDYLPLVGLPGDFWLILGIMIFSVIVMFSFFKYKKWF